MSLPYETASSGEKALGEIQKMLRGFGCNKFGNFVDDAAGKLMVQFEYRGRQVSVEASTKGYAAAWMKAHPIGPRQKMTKAQHEERAMNVASVAVYSILRDWIKGQITAIETGVVSFEGAFLGHLLLPSGKTVLEHVSGNKMLPPPAEKPC